MKKTFALLFALILLLSLFPPSARAADATISSGNTYDLASYGNGSEIRITTTEPVTLTQSNPETALTDFEIDCDVPGVNLTIDGININNSANSGRCALDFYGEGNTLTLSGSSTLISGDNEAGIRVKSGTELTINGEGSVEATGGWAGAGIGGGQGEDGGVITILSGTVKANGGDDSGAGIGGGGFDGSNFSSGGTITISGGTVIAQGGQNGPAQTGGGAGIGGGYVGSAGTILIYGDAQVTAIGGEYSAGIGSGLSGSGGDVSISGSAQVTTTGSAGGAGIGGSIAQDGCTVDISGAAQVTATGSDGGAGIGGGGSNDSGYFSDGGDGGDFNISGGVVTATGTGYGAGIGGGGCYNIASDVCGNAGNITLKGGTVYARHGDLGGMDIGAGEGQTGGTLSFSDAGLAFLYNDIYLANIITSYTHLPNVSLDSKNRMYGYPVKAGWESSSVLCYEPLTITYDANSAEANGTPPETQTVLNAPQTTFTASENTLSHTYMDFVKWNVNAGGTGTDCHPGLDYHPNTSLTLYAIWNVNTQSITVDESSISITKSDTHQLTATVLPADATDSVCWTTNNPAVAGVNQSGLVTGMGEGTATITAICGSKSADCTVTVNPLGVASVSLNYGFKNMYVDEWFILKATVSPSGASNPEITWQSSDTSVAKVTNGVVEAVGSGTCTIKATAGGAYAECPVSVGTKAVTGVSLDYSSQKMYEGGVFALTATVSPDDATNPDVTWSSSNSAVAAVNKNGIVTAVGEGSATISATAGSESDTCEVTVLPEPEVDVASVNIFNQSGFTAILYVGDTLSLSAQVSPTDATYSSVTWSSSDSSIASVTSSGQVTAKSEGSVAITAAAGDKIATYSITVKAHDEESGATPAPSVDETPAPADAPTPIIETATETVVREVVIKVDTTALPEGTKYIKLPSGEIIELTGEKTMRVTVPEDSLNGDGTIEIVALSDEQVPLGSVDVEAEDIPQETSLLNTLLGILAGLATGIAGTIVALRLMIIKKKR